MKGVVWYYKVFFYTSKVRLSNAHILHTKSPDHASITSLEFRKSLIKALVKASASGEIQDCIQSELLAQTSGSTVTIFITS